MYLLKGQIKNTLGYFREMFYKGLEPSFDLNTQNSISIHYVNNSIEQRK